MISLHTDSLHKYGLNRIFAFAKEAGYDGIEIGVTKNNYDTQNAEYIRELSEAYKLPIVALHTPLNGSEKSVEHVVQMAEYLECPVIAISAPKIFNFKFTNWLVKEVPKLRKKKNIQIALVNSSGKTLLGFLPAQALNNLADLQKFGMVTLDCSSTVSKKWDLMRIYEHLKKYIVHVHFSNVHRHKEYSLPMEGILPLESLLKKLKSNDYRGAISIMVKPTALSAGDDEKVIKNLKKIKEFVDEYFS